MAAGWGASGGGGPAWIRNGGPQRRRGPRGASGVACAGSGLPPAERPSLLRRSLLAGSPWGVTAAASFCAGAAVPYAVGCAREAWCDAQRRAACREGPAYDPGAAATAFSAAASRSGRVDAREDLPGVLKALALGMNPYDYLRYCEQKLPDPGDVRWEDFLPLYRELVSAARVRERVRTFRRRGLAAGGQVRRMEQAFAEGRRGGTVGVHEVSVLVKSLGLDDLPPAAYAQLTSRLMSREGRGEKGGGVLSLDDFRPIHAWLVAQNRRAGGERGARRAEAALRAASAFGVGILTGALRAPGAAAAVVASLARGDRDGAARRVHQWAHGGKSPASAAGAGRLVGGKRARRVAHALRDAYAARGYVWNEAGGVNVAGVRSRAALPDEYTDAVVYCYLADAASLEPGWQCCVMPASTDPGYVALRRPHDLVGSAVMVPGQYKYAVGIHAGPVPTAKDGGRPRREAQYLALVQAAPVRVWRDAHCDDTIDFQHTHRRADDEPFFSLNVGRADGAACSAGCQVVQNPDEFRHFMRVCSGKLDKHVVPEATDWNPGANEYLYTLLDQHEVEAAAGAKARARMGAGGGIPSLTSLDALLGLMRE